MEQQQRNGQTGYSNPNYQNNRTQTSNYNDYRASQQEYINNMNAAYQQQVNDAINKAYHDAYIQDLRNRGYKIKYHRSWKDYLAAFITFLIVVLILIILWQIPSFRNYFINLYNTNTVVRILADFVINIFNSFSGK